MYGDLKIFSGSSHVGLAQAVVDHLGLPLGKLHVTCFSNENLKVRIDENVREADVFIIQTACPPLSEHLMELLITIDAIKYASAARITAVLPYFPYARSDKKDETRISITARLMADLLQTAGAHRVLTMALHSPQILGFFHIPADELLATSIFMRHFSSSGLEDPVVVATDAGAGTVAGSFANRMGVPLAIVDKRRFDDSESAVSHSLIGSVEGKDAIIYDDEIATGGSILEAARIIMKFGARTVRAGATHAVLSHPFQDRLPQADLAEIVLTDTIPIPEVKRTRLPGLHVLSVAGLFGDAIQRIHAGLSISEMMK